MMFWVAQKGITHRLMYYSRSYFTLKFDEKYLVRLTDFNKICDNSVMA